MGHTPPPHVLPAADADAAAADAVDVDVAVPAGPASLTSHQFFRKCHTVRYFFVSSPV